jgi:hypothetical protein
VLDESELVEQTPTVVTAGDAETRTCAGRVEIRRAVVG